MDSPVYTEITKITSSSDAKTEPHEGRTMASVNLHARVQTGCVATKGTRLLLGECLRFSVLLKMNAIKFTLDGFELLFFLNKIYILRGVQFFMIFILFAILCCYGNQTNRTFS